LFKKIIKKTIHYSCSFLAGFASVGILNFRKKRQNKFIKNRNHNKQHFNDNAES
jgi:hypothetical protein